MAELFGKDFTREGILSRVGDVRQIAGGRSGVTFSVTPPPGGQALWFTRVRRAEVAV